MAGNTKKGKNSNWHWTNERHVHFLNSMEASFVRSMFGNNSHSPPLDRYLPDSSESTQDLGKGGRIARYASDSSSESEGKRTDKKKRILSTPKTSSKDQVVPQFQNRRDDDDNKDKDENDAFFGTVY